jgi:hypothetical protein
MSNRLLGSDSTSFTNGKTEEVSFLALVPTAEISSHNARLSLFKILRQGGKHLEAELCPTSPKCICVKALDLTRNLPRWKTYVDNLVVDGVDLEVEIHCYEEAIEVARTTVDALEPLIESRNSEPIAEVMLENLKNTLWGILQQLIDKGAHIADDSNTRREQQNTQNSTLSRSPDVQ